VHAGEFKGEWCKPGNLIVLASAVEATETLSQGGHAARRRGRTFKVSLRNVELDGNPGCQGKMCFM